MHPRTIFTTLDAIDAAPPSYTLNRPESLRRVFIVLACVSCCLLLVHYGKNSSSFVALLHGLERAQDLRVNTLVHDLQRSAYAGLISYAWWTTTHLVGFILLPWLVIRYLLKLPLRELGWQFNETAKHWQGYVLLLCPILVFVLIASTGEDFVKHYPFYKQAGRSWVDLLAWEVLYISQFIFLEFFFRGFILHGLRPAMGANAVWVMCVPYLMIHFPKLWPEAFGAILFGLFLGILALRSRSIWGGVMVHVGVAVSMDIAALWKTGQLPVSWLP